MYRPTSPGVPADSDPSAQFEIQRKERKTTMRTRITPGLMLSAALLAVPSSRDSVLLYAEVSHYQHDPRLLGLQQFFAERACPLESLAADFLVASDRNRLDWRLLPSISFVESGGGKEYRNNNVLGWDNCNRRFDTVREGIHHVADRLGTSTLYKDKGVDGILRTYNPRRSYTRLVKAVMRSIRTGEAHNHLARN
jgi:hypothetical protein